MINNAMLSVFKRLNDVEMIKLFYELENLSTLMIKNSGKCLKMKTLHVGINKKARKQIKIT